MPSFHRDELDRLHALVDHLGYDLEPSILIGGWATWLRVEGDISRDVDLIINSEALRSTLKDTLEDYSETRREGTMNVRGLIDGVHIDAYIPFESRLGERLRLRVEELARFTDDTVRKGWLLLTLEAQFVSKIAALLDRPDTEKGEKDAREIVRLLQRGVDAEQAIRVLFAASASPAAALPEFVQQAFTLLPDRAKLGRKDRRRLEDLRRIWVDEANRALRRIADDAEVDRPRLR